MPKKEYYWSEKYQNKLKEKSEIVKAYNAKYLERYHSNPELRERHKQLAREYRRRTGGISSKKWRAKNPEKYLAQAKLQHTVWAGAIIRQACQICGAPKAQGHHHDYTKPLDVMWLCPYHHKQIHKEEKERLEKHTQQE